LFINVSGHIEDWDQINLARAEGRLFNKLKWPNDPKLVFSKYWMHILLLCLYFLGSPHFSLVISLIYALVIYPEGLDQAIVFASDN